LAASEQQVVGQALVDTFLVDDGCTDGTGTVVKQRFPAVHVIEGTGHLYWCGGMRLAWLQAARNDYDAYLWLNDDVAIDRDALERLLAVARCGMREDGAVIVVGATRAEGTEETEHGVSYGGLDAKGVLPPGREPRRIELFNGNIVLVSRQAFRVVGSLSSSYTHGLGDIDYGFRAKRAGVPVWLAGGTLGSCAANQVARWQRRDISLWKRLRELHRPTGCPPWQLATLIWRSGGWWFPWSVLKLYWQVLFPAREIEKR